MPEIRVSAVVLRRADGAVLMVRKHGTHMFMNPGGKPEPGESPADCAVREVAEELRLELDPSSLVDLGQHAAPAANESGFVVRADCFLHPSPVPDDVAPAAEIAEVRWVGSADDDAILAPLFTDVLRPLAEG